MSSLFAGAGLADLMTVGNNNADTPAMRAGLSARAATLAPSSTIAGGGSSAPLPLSYYRRQAAEDTTSAEQKWKMFRKRIGDPALVGTPTPNELVQESFRDIRNPNSRF